MQKQKLFDVVSLQYEEAAELITIIYRNFNNDYKKFHANISMRLMTNNESGSNDALGGMQKNVCI